MPRQSGCGGARTPARRGRKSRSKSCARPRCRRSARPGSGGSRDRSPRTGRSRRSASSSSSSGEVIQEKRDAVGRCEAVGENQHVPHDLRVITYEAIVAGARRQFLREGTIDMEELAHELAVSRATSTARSTGATACSGTSSGAWRSGRTRRRGARSVARRRRDPRDLRPLHRGGDRRRRRSRRFLEREPQTALRVLLTPAGGVHERAVALHREIFAEAFRGREDEVWGTSTRGVPLRAAARVDPLRRHRERATPRSRGGASEPSRAADVR